MVTGRDNRFDFGTKFGVLRCSRCSVLVLNRGCQSCGQNFCATHYPEHLLDGCVASTSRGVDEDQCDMSRSILRQRRLRYLTERADTGGRNAEDDQCVANTAAHGVQKDTANTAARDAEEDQRAANTAGRDAEDAKENPHIQFRNERAVQDAEFQECLLMDQMREAQRQSEEEAKRKQQEEEELAAEQAARVEAQRLEALAAKRHRVEQHSEPDASEPSCCQVRVRLPSGRCLPNRRFKGNDAVSLVYDWVDVTCIDGEDTFTRGGYLLVEHTPGAQRREFGDRTLSLNDAGFSKQTMMFVAPCSSFDST